MANPRKKVQSYAKVAAETASSGQIILMLFDGILRFMATAREGFKMDDPIRRNEVISNNIIKAGAIVTELQSSLNMNVAGNLPMTLYRLYDYFNRRLTEANNMKDQSKMDEIEPFVIELRDSWAEMLSKQGENPASKPPPQAPTENEAQQPQAAFRMSA